MQQTFFHFIFLCRVLLNFNVSVDDYFGTDECEKMLFVKGGIGCLKHLSFWWKIIIKIIILKMILTLGPEVVAIFFDSWYHSIVPHGLRV